MIPKNVREGAEAHGLTGEKAYFTIKPNGKAFRTLIDGLYSNKVQAVIRELCSNAADSHIDAGQVKPFKVSIPTTLDAVFRVRDFGTGLTHEQVMKLYTTIFESTKEETNEQTGQLGLGSKSPFAYTDSFQVTVWDGAEKRQYLAYLERDGVPSITYVGAFPSDEPRGLEVSFPAKREDIQEFQREMQFVSMGYPTPPEVDGMSIVIPKPRMSGRGWAIYPGSDFRNAGLQGSYIRQGTVLYPTRNQTFPNLGYGWVSVVDIPIGTAEVTASREQLSFDADTVREVKAAYQRGYDELIAQIQTETAAAVTHVAKAKVAAKYRGLLTNSSVGSSHITIADSKIAGFMDGVVQRADKFGLASNGYQGGRYTTGFEVDVLGGLMFVVNDSETKMVRRFKRIRGTWNGRTWVIDVPAADRAEVIKFIKTRLELRDDQFVVASTIPDCPPPKRTGTTTKKTLALQPGQSWMLRNRTVRSDIFGDASRTGEWPFGMAYAARDLKTTLPGWGDVLFVTEKQRDALQAKGQLPDSRRLDVEIKAMVEKAVSAYDLDEVITMSQLTSSMYHNSVNFQVVVAKFFPKMKITNQTCQTVEGLLGYINKSFKDLPTFPKVKAEIQSLMDTYPLLFQRSERRHYEAYIQAVQAASV